MCIRDSPDAARQFAASLTGKQVSDFDAVQGALALNQHAGPGNDVDVLKLASVDLDGIYSPVEAIRKQAAAEFLSWRGIDDNAPFEHLLFQALEHYAPMGRLVNLTMQEARPIAEMASELFDVSGLQPDKALTALIALGSIARPAPREPGLLPCRIHTFFRGLPGLWACMDANLSLIHISEPTRPY